MPLNMRDGGRAFTTQIEEQETIGRASLVFILRDVARFMVVSPRSLGTVRAQPRFRSHELVYGGNSLLHITVI